MYLPPDKFFISLPKKHDKNCRQYFKMWYGISQIYTTLSGWNAALAKENNTFQQENFIFTLIMLFSLLFHRNYR